MIRAFRESGDNLILASLTFLWYIGGVKETSGNETPTPGMEELMTKKSLIFLVVLLIAGFILLHYSTVTSYEEQIAQLEKENQEYRIAIDKLKKNLLRLEESLKKMEEYKKRIADVLGLTATGNNTHVPGSSEEKPKAAKEK